MNFMRYMDEVFLILESFHYPELVLDYEPEDVGKSMAKTVNICYALLQSPMKCAILIWSLTMNYQVIPQANEMVKH